MKTLLPFGASQLLQTRTIPEIGYYKAFDIDVNVGERSIASVHGVRIRMKHHTRSYQPKDEPGWLSCRLQAFFDTAYFDDVRRQKESYASESIELVSVSRGIVTGLLDIEQITKDNEVFGMIWHLATHPSFRRQGIARSLLHEAIDHSRNVEITRLEAWTRDDEFVNDWYRSVGFTQISSYYHIYPTAEEITKTGIIESSVKGVYPVSAYIQYVGQDEDFLRRFKRVHECRRYDLDLK